MQNKALINTQYASNVQANKQLVKSENKGLPIFWKEQLHPSVWFRNTLENIF